MSCACAFGLPEIAVIAAACFSLGVIAVALWFHATGTRGPDA